MFPNVPGRVSLAGSEGGTPNHGTRCSKVVTVGDSLDEPCSILYVLDNVISLLAIFFLRNQTLIQESLKFGQAHG